MKTVSEFAMPEESVTTASALALSRWLADELEKVEQPETAVLRIVNGDATTYLRLET